MTDTKLSSKIQEANEKLKNNASVKNQIKEQINRDVTKMKKELFKKEIEKLVTKIKEEYQINLKKKENNQNGESKNNNESQNGESNNSQRENISVPNKSKPRQVHIKTEDGETMSLPHIDNPTKEQFLGDAASGIGEVAGTGFEFGVDAWGNAINLANERKGTAIADGQYIVGDILSNPIFGESFGKSVKILGITAISTLAVGTGLTIVLPDINGVLYSSVGIITFLVALVIFFTVIFTAYFIYYQIITPTYQATKQLIKYLVDVGEIIVLEIIRVVKEIIVLVIDLIDTYVITPIIEAAVVIGNEIVNLTKKIKPISAKVIEFVDPIFDTINSIVEPVTDVTYEIKYTIEKALNVVAGPVATILERLEKLQELSKTIAKFLLMFNPQIPLSFDFDLGFLKIGGSAPGIRKSWPCGWARYQCIPEDESMSKLIDMKFINARLKFPGDSVLENVIKTLTLGEADIDFADLDIPHVALCNKCEIFMSLIRTGRITEFASIINNPLNIIDIIGDALSSPCIQKDGEGKVVKGIVPCKMDLPIPFVPSIDLTSVINSVFSNTFGQIF